MRFRIRGLLAFLLLMVPANLAYAQTFQGNLDTANSNSCTVSGWARDPQSTAPIQVRIYQDGPATSGTLVTTFLADLLRSDLPYTDKNHGFNQSVAFPSLADGKDHAIYAYAVSGSGASGTIPGNGKVMHCTVASVVVTAPKLTLVSGESMQLDAVAIDFLGKPRTGDIFTFTSPGSNIISVSSAGLVTAKSPGIASVTATVQGTNSTSPAVLLQVIPSRIDVTGDTSDMQVGESRQFTAVARDIDSAPIPGVTFRWQVTGSDGTVTVAASVDATGLFTALGIGQMRIRAQIVYSGQSFGHLPLFEGSTLVTIKASREFRLSRLLANFTMDRDLPLRPAYNSDPAINELGQIAFTANLDGLGSALMLYDNGKLDMLASAGTPGPLGGYIYHFEGPPAINNRGEVLVRVGTSSGWGLLRASKTSGLSFIMEAGAAEGFAQMSGFSPGRNSFNDQGDMVFVGNYLPIGDTVFKSGMFLLNDTTFRFVWSAADPLPGFPAGFTFDGSNFGVDRNGVAYFRVINGSETAIYRADGLSAPVKIAGTGTLIGNLASGGLQVKAVNTLAVSPNGTIAFHVTPVSGQAGIVRVRSGQIDLEYFGQASVGQVLSVNDAGETLFVGDPGRAPWYGLYTWLNGTSLTQALRFGDPAPGAGPDVLDGGEKPNWARFGKLAANREIYAALDSPTNHLLMVRVGGNVSTLWKTGTILTPKANLNFLGVLPGSQTGPLHVFGGGGNASILEVGSAGMRTVWAPGDLPVAGVTGTAVNQATKNPSGDVYLILSDGIIRLSNGVADSVVRFPIADRDNVMVRSPNGWYDGRNSLAVNSAGTLVFNAQTDAFGRLELYNQGVLTPIVIQGGPNQTPSPAGGKFSGIANGNYHQNAVLIDERGRVMMNATVAGGASGLFIYENGQWKTAALPGVTTVGGALISSVRVMHVAGESFYAIFDIASGAGVIARYDGQNWIPLIQRTDAMPDGTVIRLLNTFVNSFAVNRRGDIVYNAYTNSGQRIVLRTADGVKHIVYSEMALTDDGDRLPSQIFEFDIRDNGHIYFTGVDSTDRSVVYSVTSLAGAPPVSFSIPNRGGTSVASSGTLPAVKVGYGRIQASAGSSTPAGLAIFGYRQNNILVTEAGVPASPAIKSGRTYAEVSPSVNTGLAIVNPNGRDAIVSFYFTDTSGVSFGNGTTTIPAEGKITAFLNQAPFNGGASLKGSFTFSSSDPISVIALRGLTNERGEFLITTLPVIDIGGPSASNTVVFPDFADGGGWSTQVILVNPGETVLAGTVQFRDVAGALTSVAVNGQSDSSFSYSIPARASLKLQTAGSAGGTVTGSVRVIPSGNTAAPSGLAVFSLRTAGVTVTEVGVLTQSAGTAFRLYAETAGSFGDVGSIQSGLAVTNNTATAANVTLELTMLDGSSTGLTGTLSVPANGQVATFLNQIPGFAALKAPFQGVLRVSSPASIALVGLRARYNERGDFLASSTPPINESSPSSTAPVYFPQIADGGGYTTQFILFSNQAGQSSGAMEVFSESGGSLNLALR